jgi:hypothetical protein
MKKWLYLGVLAMWLIPAHVLAQDVGNWGFMENDWEVTLQGSGTSDNEINDTQLAFEGSLGYFYTRNIGLGVRQGISYVDVSRGDDLWNGSTRVFADYHFDLWQMQPFLGLNVGFLYGDGVNETWFVGPEAGLKVFVLSSTFLYALFEYNYPLDDDDGEVFDDGRFLYAFGMGTTW